MKFVVLLAFLFYVQAFASQDIKEDQKKRQPPFAQHEVHGLGHEKFSASQHQVEQLEQGIKDKHKQPQQHHAQLVVHAQGHEKVSAEQNHMQHPVQGMKNVHQQQENPHAQNADHAQGHEKVSAEQHAIEHSVQQDVVQQVSQDSNKKPAAVESDKAFPKPSKVSIEIPSKVQKVVTLVSQHIPVVIAHHIVNKKRMVRSLKYRQSWQPPMQPSVGEKPRKCDFMCTELDLAVCGYNGRCYHEFKSHCDLSTHNCKNSKKSFHIVHDADCQDISKVRCYQGDM